MRIVFKDGKIESQKEDLRLELYPPLNDRQKHILKDIMQKEEEFIMLGKETLKTSTFYHYENPKQKDKKNDMRVLKCDIINTHKIYTQSRFIRFIYNLLKKKINVLYAITLRIEVENLSYLRMGDICISKELKWYIIYKNEFCVHISNITPLDDPNVTIFNITPIGSSSVL